MPHLPQEKFDSYIKIVSRQHTHLFSVCHDNEWKFLSPENLASNQMTQYPEQAPPPCGPPVNCTVFLLSVSHSPGVWIIWK